MNIWQKDFVVFFIVVERLVRDFDRYIIFFGSCLRVNGFNFMYVAVDSTSWSLLDEFFYHWR